MRRADEQRAVSASRSPHDHPRAPHSFPHHRCPCARAGCLRVWWVHPRWCDAGGAQPRRAQARRRPRRVPHELPEPGGEEAPPHARDPRGLSPAALGPGAYVFQRGYCRCVLPALCVRNALRWVHSVGRRLSTGERLRAGSLDARRGGNVTAPRKRRRRCRRARRGRADPLRLWARAPDWRAPPCHRFGARRCRLRFHGHPDGHDGGRARGGGGH